MHPAYERNKPTFRSCQQVDSDLWLPVPGVADASDFPEYDGWMDHPRLTAWGWSIPGESLNLPPPPFGSAKRKSLRDQILEQEALIRNKKAEMRIIQQSIRESEIIISQLKAILSPIRVIPREILQGIIGLLPAPEFPTSCIEMRKITTVSTTWNQVALSIPSLWSVINTDCPYTSSPDDLTYWIRRYKSWMRNAGSYSLTLTVEISESKSPLNDLILDRVARWDSLEVRGRGNRGGEAVIKLPETLRHASEIRGVELHDLFLDRDGGQFDAWQAGLSFKPRDFTLPHLETLKLSSCHLFFPAFHLPALHSFTAVEVPCSMERLKLLISAAPLRKVLKWSDFRYISDADGRQLDGEGDPVGTTTEPFPMLTTLELTPFLTRLGDHTMFSDIFLLSSGIFCSGHLTSLSVSLKLIQYCDWATSFTRVRSLTLEVNVDGGSPFDQEGSDSQLQGWWESFRQINEINMKFTTYIHRFFSPCGVDLDKLAPLLSSLAYDPSLGGPCPSLEFIWLSFDKPPSSRVCRRALDKTAWSRSPGPEGSLSSACTHELHEHYAEHCEEARRCWFRINVAEWEPVEGYWEKLIEWLDSRWPGTQ